MKIVIENLSDGETIPHKILLVRRCVDNLLEGKFYVIHSFIDGVK